MSACNAPDAVASAAPLESVCWSSEPTWLPGVAPYVAHVAPLKSWNVTAPEGVPSVDEIDAWSYTDVARSNEVPAPSSATFRVSVVSVGFTASTLKGSQSPI